MSSPVIPTDENSMNACSNLRVIDSMEDYYANR